MRAEPLYEPPRRSLRAVAVPEPAEVRPFVEVRQSTVSAAPSSLRALQRTSGNRAVGALLRRQPADATRADARKIDAVSATIIMDDPIGVMPLLSFSPAQGSTIYVEVPSTVLDSDLWRYMVQGKKLDHVTISTAKFNLELDDVLITSFDKHDSDGGAVVHLALNFGSQHLKQP
jgi:hypothetical protein